MLECVETRRQACSECGGTRMRARARAIPEAAWRHAHAYRARASAAVGRLRNVAARVADHAVRSRQDAMMRVLLLGGTGDALQIARGLAANDVYSLAGIGKPPDGLTCTLRVGGFGGAHGLQTYLATERIGLLIDA